MKHQFICFSMVLLNLAIFLATMCKDPGVKPEIYEHHIKVKEWKRKNKKNENKKNEDDDIEKNNN